jgi:uncharacterized membrane protein
MHTFWYYILIFTYYSCIGWLLDTIYTRFYEGRWVKRGFHHGPFYMLYGWGALASVLTFNEHSSLLVVIPMAILYSCIIEYAGSFLFEKFGMRYWDYTENRLNIHGRICFQSISIFVVGIVAMVYLIQPIVMNWLSRMPNMVIDLIGLSAFCYLFVWGVIRMGIQYRYFREHPAVRSQAYDIEEN